MRHVLCVKVREITLKTLNSTTQTILAGGIAAGATFNLTRSIVAAYVSAQGWPRLVQCLGLPRAA